MEQYELPMGDADVFVGDAALGDYFEEVAKGLKNPKQAANWVINNLQAKLVETETSVADLKFPAVVIGELIGLVEGGQISSKIAQEVFPKCSPAENHPRLLWRRKGFRK